MLPSVTQVISPFVDFSGIREDVLEYAAQRGTAVHAACAAIALGLWPIIEDEHRGYVDSFQRWFDLVVEEVHGVELELSDCDFGFVGHLDLLIRVKGDAGLAVVDLKTPLVQQLSWRAQLAAYRHLACKAGFQVGRSFSLRLKKDGGRALVSEYTNHPHDFAGFIAALSAWNYFKPVA